MATALTALTTAVLAGCGDAGSWVEAKPAEGWSAQYGDAANSSYTSAAGAEALTLEWSRSVKGELAAQAAGGADGEHILNLARVGAARAALQRGDRDAAIEFASQVPEDFVAYVRYVETPTNQRNYFWTATTGTNHTLGVDEKFRDLNDTRVRHMAEGRTGHNQATILYTPVQSPAFADWDPTVPMDVSDSTLIAELGFKQGTDMILASYLEAQYILAEAGGMSAAELRAFINERRAVGGQGDFTGTDAELQAELRDQRRRDFFLSGHRLGDLRRYLALYGVDEFPSGPHPNDEEWGWGNYGSATCFIPHRNEEMGIEKD